MSTEARAFLVAGLAEVRMRPWIQHATLREADGGVCAMGALFRAQVTARRMGHAFTGDSLLSAHDRLEAAARRITGDDAVTVPAYNDTHAQNKADIIRLFQTAITDCR
ncbi:hypothetical protein [Actinomadura sp. NEAU-AAG7]|uniref:DUF6197 family protein n=1 Tax=Actinomadura sp. NEAU-AAG7 TaxID=2839640 RepID=UPI001BE3DCB7|nr:hypothetical protein [Actinomadura sp. NEAU-AAG7]MBT2213481.1 hypothetical protein [Actinomadura sp. NEAU-AAG7]